MTALFTIVPILFGFLAIFAWCLFPEAVEQLVDRAMCPDPDPDCLEEVESWTKRRW